MEIHLVAGMNRAVGAENLPAMTVFAWATVMRHECRAPGPLFPPIDDRQPVAVPYLFAWFLLKKGGLGRVEACCDLHVKFLRVVFLHVGFQAWAQKCAKRRTPRPILG
jgi:hypothetical protein